jgi:hypothetical protein
VAVRYITEIATIVSTCVYFMDKQAVSLEACGRRLQRHLPLTCPTRSHLRPGRSPFVIRTAGIALKAALDDGRRRGTLPTTTV